MSQTEVETLPDHFPLSCSGAKRWILCPGSKNAVDDREPGVMAQLGSLGHRVVECLLNGEAVDLDEAEQALVDDLDAEGKQWFTDAILTCFDYVRGLIADMGPNDQIMFEVKVKSEKIPNHGGTADVILYRAADKSLHCVDFKFGRVAVDGRKNMQIGAYLNLARQLFPDAETFTGTIIQPLFKGVDHHEYTKAWLDDWMIKAAVAADPENHTRKADPSWCEYCPLLTTCEEFTRQARATAAKFPAIKEVEKPTDEEVKTLELILMSAKVSEKQKGAAGDLLKDWARTGAKLNFHKIGHTTRRSWDDEAAAKDIAAAGDVPEIDLVEVGVISPAKLRDNLGMSQETFDTTFGSMLQLKKSTVLRVGTKPSATEAALFDAV